MMNRDQLLATFHTHDDEIVLRADNPALQHLGAWLTAVTDSRDELVIRDFTVLPLSPSAPADQVIIHGQATVLNTAIDELKGVFVLVDGAVDHFYLLMRPASSWRLTQSFSDLPNYAGGTAFFEDFHFIDPLFVLSARAQAITDENFKLDGEFFEGGLNLFASGLSELLPLHHYGLDQFPAGAGLAAHPPGKVKAQINHASAAPSINIRCWWEAHDGAKIGSAAVKRMGIGFHSRAGKGAARAPGALWLWDLQLHPDEESFVMTATVPGRPDEQPIYAVTFASAQFLKHGAGALGSLTGGSDPSDILPFKDGPLMSLATLAFQPGSWVGANFILLDRKTHKPYSWEAIEEFLTLEDVQLSLGIVLEPSVTTTVGVLGIANIDGYQFEVEYIPDQIVSGKLYKPRQLPFDTFINDLLGHGLDFPNLQLQLIEAGYTNDLATKRVSYDVAVGGHIDLLGNGGFMLKGVGFAIETANGKTTRKQLTGYVTVLDEAIRFLADYEDTAGWRFEGRADPALELPLNDLIDDLLHRAGLAVPPGAPQVTLTEFGLRYGSKLKQFRLWGRAKWEPPEDAQLPWFSGEIDTVVDINSTTNPQTAVREVDIDLLWLYTSGDRTFQAAATHNHEGNAFLISWEGGANKQTLGMHELNDLLHLGSIFQLPGGEGWSIFEFSRLLVGYQPNPRLIQLQSESRLGSGKLNFDANFAKGSSAFGGNWTGDADTDTLGLSDLLEALDSAENIELFGSIGEDIFEFQKLSFRYLKERTLPSLQFVGGAGNAFYKDVFLVMLRSGEEWGFVTGAAFKERTSLKDIPDIGKIPGLDIALGLLSIEPVYLLYASTTVARFTPPVAGVGVGSNFAVTPGNGSQLVISKTLNGKGAAPQRRLRLSKGPAVAAKIIFEDSDNPVLDNIHTLIGVSELDARITFGNEFDVLALLPGQLEIPTGAGETLKLSNAFFSMGIAGDGETTLQVGGETDINFLGEVRKIEVCLIVSEEAAVASEHLQGIPLPPVHALPGVRFKEDYWLEMGVQFEPEGMDMGFMGDFYIGENPNRYTGKAVFVVEMIEEIPNPLYVQFSIDTLDLWAMFEAVTGTMARVDDIQAGLKSSDELGEVAGRAAKPLTKYGDHALEFLKQQYKNLQFIFNKVSLDDVAFHWADSMVILPDGTMATPGVGFRGTLDFFGWDTFAAFEFSSGSSPKLSGHLEMEPIHLQHVVSVSGDGKGVRVREARGEKEGWEYWKDAGRRKESVLQSKTAHLHAAVDEKQADQAVTLQNAADYVLKPGGPVFIVSGLHAPFLHADMRIDLFDLLHSEVRADVDETGLSFQLAAGIGSITDLVLACKLQVKEGFRFEAYGTFGLHLRADLSFELPLIGEIPIVLDAGLDADMHLIVTEDDFTLSIDGSFEFEGVDLPMPTLTLTVPFTSFSELPPQILDHIDDRAVEIFGDLFDDLGHVAEVAVKAVGAAAVAVADEVEKIGENVAEDVQAAGEAVAHAAEAAEEDVEEAAHTLEEGADAVKYAAKVAADKLEKAAAETAGELAHEAEVVLDGAAETVKDVGRVVGLEVEEVANQIADITSAAEHKVAQIAEEVGHDVQAALDVANEAADAVVSAAEDAAKATLDAANEAVEWTAHAAEDAVKWTAGAAGAAAGGVVDAAGAAAGAISGLFS